MAKNKKRETKPVTAELKAQIIEAFHAGMSWSGMVEKFGRHQSTIAYQLRGEKRQNPRSKAVVKVTSGSAARSSTVHPPPVVNALEAFVAALAGTPVSTIFIDLEKQEATIEYKKVETISFS